MTLTWRYLELTVFFFSPSQLNEQLMQSDSGSVVQNMGVFDRFDEEVSSF